MKEASWVVKVEKDSLLKAGDIFASFSREHGAKYLEVGKRSNDYLEAREITEQEYEEGIKKIPLSTQMARNQSVMNVVLLRELPECLPEDDIVLTEELRNGNLER